MQFIPHLSNWMFQYKKFVRYLDRGAAYPGFILNVVGNFSMIGSFFKLMSWNMNYVAIALMSYLVTVYVLGVIDIRNDVMKREIELNNKENVTFKQMARDIQRQKHHLLSKYPSPKSKTQK